MRASLKEYQRRNATKARGSNSFETPQCPRDGTPVVGSSSTVIGQRSHSKKKLRCFSACSGPVAQNSNRTQTPFYKTKNSLEWNERPRIISFHSNHSSRSNGVKTHRDTALGHTHLLAGWHLYDISCATSRQINIGSRHRPTWYSISISVDYLDSETRIYSANGRG